MREVKYYKTVDIAKGLGIFFVIWGHCMIPRSYIIYSFHMPLFFAISGFLYSSKSSVKDFIKSKIKRILIPYYFFSLASLFLYLIKSIISNDLTLEIKIIMKIIIGLPISINIALWFLPCLFCISICYKLLNNYFDKKLIHILILLLSGIGYLMWIFVPSIIPLKIDVALTGIVFYHIGYIVKINANKDLKNKIIVVFISFVSWLLSAYFNIFIQQR
jgi:fucose 4-O-acetylase-like acetyltransferase